MIQLNKKTAEAAVIAGLGVIVAEVVLAVGTKGYTAARNYFSKRSEEKKKTTTVTTEKSASAM